MAQRKRYVDSDLLKRILGYMEEDLKKNGWCDHQNNVCACRMVQDMDKLNYLVTGESGKYAKMFPEEQTTLRQQYEAGGFVDPGPILIPEEDDREVMQGKKARRRS